MIIVPTLEAVKTHVVPAGFNNAKLGIFIHWSFYFIAGWAALFTHEGALNWETVASDIVVQWPHALPDSLTHTIKIVRWCV